MKKQLDRGPLEIRRFTCPYCEFVEVSHIYDMGEPLLITCACGDTFMWDHEEKRLWESHPPYIEHTDCFIVEKA